MFALLGPNGAGKTTTVEILEGHRTRTGGMVDVLGFDAQTGGRDYREHIGIVLQEAGFEEDFTSGADAPLPGPVTAHVDVDELIDHVGLAEKRKPARHDALRRPAPPPRPGAGTRGRPRPGLPRRAHHRIRRVGAPPLPGSSWTASRGTGQDGAAHHALHGRGQHQATGGVACCGSRVLDELAAPPTPLLHTFDLRDDVRPPTSGPGRYGHATGARRCRCARTTGHRSAAADLVGRQTQRHLGNLTVTRLSLEEVYLELIAGTDAETASAWKRRCGDGHVPLP